MSRACLVILCLLFAFQGFTNPACAQALKKYKPLWNLAGKIRVAGSGALNGELEILADTFQQIYPGVEIAVERNGEERTPTALLAGAADLGSLSRALTREETAAIESRYLTSPIGVVVGLDALAIYVNRENPIACLSIPDLDRIFSANRIASGGDAVERWGQLVSDAAWLEKPISRLGRRENSGSYSFFRNSVIDGDAFRRDVKALESGEAVVRAVAGDRYAIGYSSGGSLAQGARVVSISNEGGAICKSLTAENVARGDYPLARSLYIYALKTQDPQTNLIIVEFLRYLVSREGQMKMTEIGFIPIDRDSQDVALRRLKAIATRR